MKCITRWWTNSLKWPDVSSVIAEFSQGENRKPIQKAGNEIAGGKKEKLSARGMLVMKNISQAIRANFWKWLLNQLPSDFTPLYYSQFFLCDPVKFLSPFFILIFLLGFILMAAVFFYFPVISFPFLLHYNLTYYRFYC